MSIAKKDSIRVNFKIRSPEVRVIGPNGDQLGVMNVPDAIKRAQEAGLDLVEVAPGAEPPVCRIIDYSKYRYEQEKREKEAKKKQKVIHVKELRFGPKIEENDYQVKLHALEKFLKRGDRVKVSMRFKGRQMAHIDLGRKILDRVASDISAVGEVEKAPELERRTMTMQFRPK